jgi:hypothetical protein
MGINWYRVFKIDPKVEKFVRADQARKAKIKAKKVAKKTKKKK